MDINYHKLRFAFQRLFKEMFVGKALFDSVITAGSEALYQFIKENDIGFLFSDLVLMTEYKGKQADDNEKLRSYIYSKQTSRILSAWDIEALQHRIYPAVKPIKDEK